MPINLQAMFSAMAEAVFQDAVADAIQCDGQRALNAAASRDVEALRKIAKKYERDAGRSQGGGGAGPGKIKLPRPGAPAVYRLASMAAERLAA